MKRFGFQLIFFALLLAAVGATVWLALNRPPTSLRMPNGMEVRFISTSVGGGAFTTDKPWQRMARRVLPARFQDWLTPAISGSSSSGNSNSVTVFWEVIDPTGAPINSPPWSDYHAVDDDGFRFSRGGGYYGFGGIPGHHVYGLRLRAYPRRQPEFQFHFLDRNGVSIGMLRLSNPIKGPFPDWTPEALPITRTNGAVSLTLTALSEGGKDSNPFVRPEWEVTATDPLWTNSRPSNMQFSDATGNEDYARLSRREPAWKLQAWVHRRRPDDFTSDERLVLTNLVVPAAGEFRALDVTAELAGIKLRVDGLSGPGNLYITNGTNRVILPATGFNSGWSTSSDGKTTIEHWGSTTHFFLVDATGLNSQDELRFRLLDERGTEVKLDSSPGSYGSGNRPGVRTYVRKFTPSDAVRSVMLEIIVSHPREFEFMINPAEIRRSPPAK